MNKSILLIELLLCMISSQTITITSPCSCVQLYIQEDCYAKSGCEWDSVKKLCIVSTSPTNLITEGAAYCDQYGSGDCASAYPCAWKDSKCTFFTGCTVFTYDTDTKCQAVSKRCITDGTHCVEIGVCSSYVKQKACVINTDGKYCHWNNQDTTKQICENIEDCTKLPSTLNSDSLCRAQLNKCTASAAGGCIESGVNCSDQLAEIGCVKNKDRTQDCFWKESKCWDKTCDNAPISLNTDKGCKDFLSTCTTKANGGCITRKSCSDATIQAACYTDSYGKDCFWNTQTCVNKTCTNALQSNKTNSSCQQYLSTCITTGNGCVENTGCEAAKIQDACNKTQEGKQCHWDGTYCKLKTCNNAGPNYVSYDQCVAYMSTCTNQGTSGCTDRTCENAPTSILTNDQCKKYLNENCITKLNGGCRTNTICEDIDIEIACSQDSKGNICFWNDNKCKSRICSNAPSENNTHELCQKFSSTCTIGSSGTCVDYLCENAQNQENCTYDFNKKLCIYKSKCYKKICAYASYSINTHEGCQEYLTTCTLSNSGVGCMDIPQKCQQITNNKSCKIRADGGKCGLQGNNCVDQVCSTAPVDGTYNDSTKCNTYKTGCVVNNNLDGCMDLPTTCAARTKLQNCQAEQDKHEGGKCQWDDKTNASNPVCIDVKCENAYLAIGSLANLNQEFCWTYYYLNCVVTTNNGAPTCIPRPNSCNGLVEGACKQSKVLVGDINCFWDIGSSTCKVVACSSITFASGTIDHAACNSIMNTCTVNKQIGTGCIDLQELCTQYSFEDQCRFDKFNNTCKWTAQGCIDLPCRDADESHITNNLCQQYSAKCILTQKRCAVKKQTCAEIKTQNNCSMNTIQAKKQCKWNIVTESCSDVAFACSQIVGVGLSMGYCQSVDITCSVNFDGTACINAQAKCSDYGTSQSNCSWATTEKFCKFTNGTCVVDCALAPGPYDYDYCQNYNTLCTVRVDATGCANMVDDCTSTDVANCTKSISKGQCYINSAGACYSVFDMSVTEGNCNKIHGTKLTVSYCMIISASGTTCSVNAAQTACVEKKDSCSGYSKDDCYYGLTDFYCQWMDSGPMANMCAKKSSIGCSTMVGSTIAACIAQNPVCAGPLNVSNISLCGTDCSVPKGPYFDLNYCQKQDHGCGVKLDGSACVYSGGTCTGKSQADCVYAVASGYCYYNGTDCIAASETKLAEADCGKVTGERLLPQYCKNISVGSNSCSVNAAQTACIVLQGGCSSYSLENCFATVISLCVVNAAGSACTEFAPQDPCSAIKINGLTNNYTDYKCQLFKSICQAKTDGTGCQEKPIIQPACSTFTGSNLNYYYCVGKNITCSVNAAKNACVIAKNNCADYSQTDCGYAVSEGECIYSGSACVQKNCYAAPYSISNMNGCQTFSPNCVFVGGGCDSRGTCDSYIIKDTCTQNLTGGDCLWNPQNAICVDKSCSTAEASTYFNDNTKCETVGNCTVKDSGMGCMTKASCSTYTIQAQCKTSDKGVLCAWNTNGSNAICADKSCSTASKLTYSDHSSCIGYLAGCTVNIVNGTSTPQGCTSFKPCSQYAQAQCYLSSENDSNNVQIQCAWNGTICANKSCATATQDINTVTLCNNYWPGCTVNATDDGCIAIPSQCEGMTKNQCFTDSVDFSNRKCIWLDDKNQCITKTCENSPNYGSEADCNSYLLGCTVSIDKCKSMICEDFQFKTDSQCKQALQQGICTTNGNNCVTRSTCDQAQVEAGCTSDNNEQLCQWMTPTNQVAFCTNRTCQTAPNTLTTEQQCQQYFTPISGSCTTKKDGGCTLKGSCSVATVQAACTFDNNNVQCAWDTDISKCRPKECKDFNGNSIAECQKIKSNCTVGLNGKCATMKNCEDTKVKESCIQGLNGPCLWIDKYENNDGTKGSCFKYDSCKSLSWKNDLSCKWISQNCTTDGTQCIGITSCAETNTNGGCQTGTDGSCIQTISAKGANDNICKQFTSCTAAYYLTHEQCNNANPSCTSDYTNGCIPLNACSSYAQEKQCIINKQGPIKDQNGKITSTGLCAWKNNACNDQQCTDILLTSQQECQNAMKTCTTDGTTCILQGACNSYKTENVCNSALGTEGLCFWVIASVTAAATCRPKICADLTNGTTNEICSQVSNCVSDGINCVSKSKCSGYTTQIGCMGIGIDGLCAWIEPIAPATQGNCILMNGCSVAKDELSCNQAQDRCYWNSVNKICTVHTCDSYYSQYNVCKLFLTWDQKNYNICALRKDKCIAVDAKTLDQRECYSLTAYQYSWSSSIQKCALCGVDTQVNNSNNNSVNQTTEFGPILYVLTILLVSILI